MALVGTHPGDPGKALTELATLLDTVYQVHPTNLYVAGRGALDLAIVQTIPYRHTPDAAPQAGVVFKTAYVVCSPIFICYFPQSRVEVEKALKESPQGQITVMNFEVEYPAEPLAFKLFLELAHGYDTPSAPFDRITPSLFMHAAAYSRKFGLTELLRPKVNAWKEACLRYFPPSEHPMDYQMDWEWMIIGRELSDQELYAKHFLRLKYFVTRDDLKSRLPSGTEELTVGMIDLCTVEGGLLLARHLRNSKLLDNHRQMTTLLDYPHILENDICRERNRDCIRGQRDAVTKWLDRNSLPLILYPTMGTQRQKFSGSPAYLFHNNTIDVQYACQDCRKKRTWEKICDEIQQRILQEVNIKLRAPMRARGS